MKRSILGLTAACLALILVAGPTTAEEGTWVADSGKVHQLEHGNTFVVSDGDAERFDLSDLRDGETRVFGAGPRAVTATRSGDSISLSRSATGEDVSRIDVTCDIESDTCTVLTFPNEPDKVMIAIEKERTCVNGVGDCDMPFGEMGAEGHVVVNIDCDGEDCEDIHALHLDEMLTGELQNTFTVDVEALAGEEGHPSRIVIRRSGEAGENDGNVWVTGGAHVIRELHGDKVLLRCSEGDATITVEKNEADDTFLCPKHSTPMEQVAGHGGPGVRVIRKGKHHEH